MIIFGSFSALIRDFINNILHLDHLTSVSSEQLERKPLMAWQSLDYSIEVGIIVNLLAFAFFIEISLLLHI